MKSPFTGKEMTLKKESKSINFRKEAFNIIYHYYLCEDTSEQFTTTELDEINMNQLHNQYRDKSNIPFPEEIKEIREKYGVSASKMSEILGFGTNSYRQYEAGEMPSISNARLIQMATDPVYFKTLIDLWDSNDSTEKKKILKKVNQIIDELRSNSVAIALKDYFLGSHLADICSGYKNPNLEKFTEMVVFFSEKVEPFKTKMNKLLFYADFSMFSQSCYSISGIRYQAIDRGPVPNNYQSIFEFIYNNNNIDIKYIHFPKGQSGEKFIARKDRPFKPQLFTVQELKVLNEVAEKFKGTSTNEMVEYSHLEEAWKNNMEEKKIISYNHAFELKTI